jgi:class 3 adenylate cyclase
MGMERKLTAIFSTDVKGYSRLMGDDEEATIHTLKTYREVITNLIEDHHGRVVDSPSDNMLAKFASAVDAVKSAVAIQHELKTRNTELEAHRQMEFRIGLNVGDVITIEKAAEFARKALALDDSLSLAYITLGQLALWRDKQHTQALI